MPCFDTNLTGALFCSWAAHPAMKRVGGGKPCRAGHGFRDRPRDPG
jgi:hypothetical protein